MDDLSYELKTKKKIEKKQMKKFIISFHFVEHDESEIEAVDKEEAERIWREDFDKDDGYNIDEIEEIE